MYRLTTIRHASSETLALRRALACALPHLKWRHHAIGALQAYLTEGVEPETRVHIWHPELVRPGFEGDGQVHDHRFRLKSTVLCGSVEHHEVTLVPREDGQWQRRTVTNARKGDPTPPALVDDTRYALHVVSGTVAAGYVYEFPRRAFHCSRPTGLAVTLVTKIDPDDYPAHVLTPFGREPRHAFDGESGTDPAYWIGQAMEALAK